MPDPIRVPLSEYQQARLAQLRVDARCPAYEVEVRTRINEHASAVAMNSHDLEALGRDGWRIELKEDAILIVPPGWVEHDGAVNLLIMVDAPAGVGGGA